MNSKTPVTKAVIPAAGFGTRFLPQTKAMPKEMLPLVDKPIVQHIVEELVEAGIKDIIIVTGYHKRSIEDHFDSPSGDLVETLKAGGEKKKHLLEETKRISNLANFYYLRQKGPKGNLTPLLNARSLIGNEPFIYTWADDFFETNNKPSMSKQLINTYNKYQTSVLPCVKAKTDEDYDKYGFASGKKLDKGEIEVDKIIEKPGKSKAPSNLGIVSGMLFTPDALKYFDQAKKVQQQENFPEFTYTHLITAMLNDDQKVIAKEIEGGEFIDTGNKLAWLKAQVMYGAQDSDIEQEFKTYLKEFIKVI